jgi:hypothetical protein
MEITSSGTGPPPHSQAYCSSWAAQEQPRLRRRLPRIRWSLVCGHGSDGPWFQTRCLTCYIAERAERKSKRPPKMSSNIRQTFATAWVRQDHRRWQQQTCRSRILDLSLGKCFSGSSISSCFHQRQYLGLSRGVRFRKKRFECHSQALTILWLHASRVSSTNFQSTNGGPGRSPHPM